jgi:hypothetical protein
MRNNNHDGNLALGNRDTRISESKQNKPTKMQAHPRRGKVQRMQESSLLLEFILLLRRMNGIQTVAMNEAP